MQLQNHYDPALMSAVVFDAFRMELIPGVSLLHTDKLVKTIAGELGFPDEYYFPNLFRRKRGVSPSGFRNGPEPMKKNPGKIDSLPDRS